MLSSYFNSTNIKVDNFTTIKLNQTLLMNMEAGNTLIFKLKSEKPLAAN